jgi:hydrogenase maturation protein HypF
MTVRKRIIVRGIVQGVGLRPTVARLAREHNLSGFVRNERNATVIELQGSERKLADFVRDLPLVLPAGAALDSFETLGMPPVEGESGFLIAPSVDHGESRFSVPPDLAICPACIAEFFDPANRRFHYPFITCGSCGPRYSYLQRMPHDRGNSTMVDFPLCDACRAEYEDPDNRRYHIEGISCPDCGPRVSGFDEGVAAILSGAVAAVKGIGGYHLSCLAEDEKAVARLRARKNRPAKPLAVMYPSLEALEDVVHLSGFERAALLSSESPIVLVPKSSFHRLPAEGVAPHNSSIGVMIPYSPLHLLVLSAVGRPLIMTSANIPGDPLIIDDESAQRGLVGVADAIIGHNRRILKRADDGVVMICAEKTLSIRKGRGSAPRPIKLAEHCRLPLLAVGAELKSTVSVAAGDDLATSPHIGDLEGPASFTHFQRTVLDMLDYYGVEPALVVCDLHPDYESTRFAEQFAQERNIPILKVQHHYAHLLASAIESGRLYESKNLLGLILDGTGYGPDGTIWGGELILALGDRFERLGHLDTFPLPGGEAAVREPWRIAAGLGLLRYLPEDRNEFDVEAVFRIARDRALSPLTSSCGRLFDAAAAILGFDSRISFEGQAAVWLEALASKTDKTEVLVNETSAAPHSYDYNGTALLSSLAEKVEDPRRTPEERLSRLALAFHLDLAEGLARTASLCARRLGIQELYLSGGVFQNRIFTGAMLAALRSLGIMAVTGSRIPVNDACISIGQAAYGILASAKENLCA